MALTNREVERAAREMHRYIHSNMRLRDRYGIEMDLDEYREICQMYRNRKCFQPRDLSTGELEGWVLLKGVWVCFSFKKGEGLVATCMPCPPGAQVIITIANWIMDGRMWSAWKALKNIRMEIKRSHKSANEINFTELGTQYCKEAS